MSPVDARCVMLMTVPLLQPQASAFPARYSGLSGRTPQLTTFRLRVFCVESNQALQIIRIQRVCHERMCIVEGLSLCVRDHVILAKARKSPR